MGIRIDNKKGKNLYEFWGGRISETISQDLEDHKDKTVINCASNEYFKSINNSSLNANFVTPEFKEIKNGKTRMISFFAKKARGAMSDYIVRHRINEPDGLKAFKSFGYRFNPNFTKDDCWVFTRKESGL